MYVLFDFMEEEVTKACIGRVVRVDYPQAVDFWRQLGYLPSQNRLVTILASNYMYVTVFKCMSILSKSKIEVVCN